ncbi:MAG: hypothetical protein ACRDV2_08355 [Actinomycetes bacterium]
MKTNRPFSAGGDVSLVAGLSAQAAPEAGVKAIARSRRPMVRQDLPLIGASPRNHPVTAW